MIHVRRIVVVMAMVGLMGSLVHLPLAMGEETAPGMVTIDGHTVPDVGPLPTAVPIPATNLNYASKIKLGEQLYFRRTFIKKQLHFVCILSYSRPGICRSETGLIGS